MANPLEGRIIHWFGEISYATYLSHALRFTLFKIVFVSDVRNVPLPLLGLFLLIVLAASAALYHGFELPAQKWMNRRGPRAARIALGAPSVAFFASARPASPRHLAAIG